MFGSPEYFKESHSKIPAPANLKGWAFYILWLAAILAPCIYMVISGKYLQSGIWFLISAGWFSTDTWLTSRNIRRKSEMDKLFFIGEEDSHVSTKNYDLNLRSSSTDS